MGKRIISIIIIVLVALNCGLAFAESSFDDVKAPSWYSNAVDYVVTSGYMAGIGAKRFEPNGKVTRAQVVQILYAKEGKPSTGGEIGFTDIPADKWFSDAVKWSSRNGIVAGYPDNSFKPDQPVTREQLIVILYKYAGFRHLNLSIAEINLVTKFPDAHDISAYAYTSLQWGVEKGLISGTGKGIEPKGTATRAQMAVIIKAFCEKIEESNHKGTGDTDTSKDRDDVAIEDPEVEAVDNNSVYPKPVITNEPDNSMTWELPEDDSGADT